MTRRGRILVISVVGLFVISVVGLFVACVATAAPAPEDKPFVAGWDKPTDPDHDCDFHVEAGKLTITVPGKEHDLSIERDRMNAPRVLRGVSGDFTVQVRVAGKFNPSAESDANDRVSFLGAGLLMWVDDKTYIRLERAALSRDEVTRTYASFELRDKGEWVRQGDASVLPLEDRDTYLRLTRKGNKVAGAVSQDGSKWTELEAMTVDLPEKLKVGVAAVSTSKKEMAPTFDRFELTEERNR